MADRFRNAAAVCRSGASLTLGEFGPISALAAGLSVYWMTKVAHPVSTSRAIVGAILGLGIYQLSPVPAFIVVIFSSQSIAGAVIGIGIAKGGKISTGWVATPLISAVVAFIALFIVQNVFNQVVF